MGEAAPLLGTAVAPVPPGGLAEWFNGAGGARLRAALFPAIGAARGTVVVSPGRTEPIEKYFETVAVLRARGFAALVHDWRGQGLSHRMLEDRLLGHASGYGDFLEDYRRLLDAFSERLPRPWLALGHSMGGCLTLLALAEGEDRFAGAILSSPMLGVQLGSMPAILGRLLAAGMARAGQAGRPARGNASAEPPTPFEENTLTHDRARYARNEAQVAAAPDLALGVPTWGWVDFALSATARLRSGPGIPRIAVPVTIVAAGDEALVDNVAARRAAARLPRGRYLEIPGAYHEILQETDDVQAVFWRAFEAMAEDALAAARRGGMQSIDGGVAA